ncbi:MAG: arginine--tRNA ligase [Bacteroidales bacterium]|nr:arginine--tRNA ligase [Bacteroidales bacterium]MDD4685400.1 arginine--tRNA ligase [Bacteroidales bacterium]
MIDLLLQESIKKALVSLYDISVDLKDITLYTTKKEFEGDFTLVVFPFVKQSRKSPEQTAKEIGDFVVGSCEDIVGFNVIKGFLNFEVSNYYWLRFIDHFKTKYTFGYKPIRDEKPIVVEYSSPNTNKPLHLGHIRNNLLGWSVAEILKANGYAVRKVNLVNDRGIHICKSMIAWQKFGQGETPETSGLKGDHLVGKYYVLFDKEYKKEIATMISEGVDKELAEKTAPIMLEAQDMLRKWEAKDKDVIDLWKRMNAWVYKGFDETYYKMGVDFDKVYYESETYLLGKDLVREGLEKGVLYKKEDNSIWCDLTHEGLDEKLLQRADGTSVYMTQDLGTATLRHNDFNSDNLLYVVGNEQNYHFDVLKLVLKKIGFDWAENLRHLSYGMVELPEGKMKSREGTVVDADDLIKEMINTAKEQTLEHGKTDGFSEAEAEKLYWMLAMGALKYFILKVDPTKNMLFNPKESIDFTGNTGPFIQYTHARIRSIIRKAQEEKGINLETLRLDLSSKLNSKELEIIRILYQYPAIVDQAGKTFSPALIANYVYDLAKSFNAFYQDVQILREEDEALMKMRIGIASFVGNTIKSAMELLGITVPERM